MAKFDITGNYDKVSDAYIYDANNRISKNITYTENSNEIFIYSNYPEYLEDSHIGDKGTAKYINRVDVKNKTKMLIYLTHHLEKLKGTYYLAIRVYNPSTSSTVKFTKLHEGFSNSTSWNNPGYAWEDFFSNRSDSLTLSPRSSGWLAVKTITKTGNSGGAFLDYFGEFTVNNPFSIAIYICKNKNNIPDSTSAINWTPSDFTYSGYANNYSLIGNKTLDMADALVSYRNSFFFGISNPYGGLGETIEKVPFYATQSGEKVTNNIGNYGLQYKLSFKFKNTSNKAVKVKCYLISNTASHFAGLASVNGTSKFLDSSGSSNRWNFHTTETITKSSGIVTIDFTYCHLALGSRGAILQFEAVEV